MTQHVQFLQSIRSAGQKQPGWYRKRDRYITCSDWAAVLGENKYKSRAAVLRDKIGLGTPFHGNAATRHGFVTN